jgi:hypothetical protein
LEIDAATIWCAGENVSVKHTLIPDVQAEPPDGGNACASAFRSSSTDQLYDTVAPLGQASCARLEVSCPRIFL